MTNGKLWRHGGMATMQLLVPFCMVDHENSHIMCVHVFACTQTYPHVVGDTYKHAHMHTQTHRHTDTVQNSALRCILKCNKCILIQTMHNELKILTLNQRRQLNMAVECYKQATIEESSLHSMFVKPVRSRATRRGDSNKVTVPKVDSDTGRKAFSYRGPFFWNELENDLKCQENKNIFKNAYLRKLLQDVNHAGWCNPVLGFIVIV